MSAPSLTSGHAGSLKPISWMVRIFAKAVRGLILGGAWLFALLSFAVLGAMLVSNDWGDPRKVCALLSSSDDGVITRSVWGLTYHGYAGGVLAFAEAGMLLAAMWLSTRPVNRPRRFGLSVLLGWAAWWLVGGFWVFPMGGELEFLSLFSVLAFLFTVGRTAFCWTGATETEPGRPVESEESRAES